MATSDDESLAAYLRLISPAPAGCVRTLDGDVFALPDTMALAEFDALCRRVLELPEGPHIELHRGKPVVHPKPDGLHQRFRSDLMFALGRHFEVIEQDRRFGAWGSDLRSEPLQSYLTADLMIIPRELSDENLSYLPNGGIPPLIIEVLSSETAYLDLGVRRDIYRDYGVPEYWVCDPFTCAILAHTLTDGAYERVAIDRDVCIWSDFLNRRVRVITERYHFNFRLETR